MSALFSVVGPTLRRLGKVLDAAGILLEGRAAYIEKRKAAGGGAAGGGPGGLVWACKHLASRCRCV